MQCHEAVTGVAIASKQRIRYLACVLVHLPSFFEMGSCLNRLLLRGLIMRSDLVKENNYW